MARRPRRPRILVVDDHPDIRLLIHDILAPLGYAVEAVASARAALRRLDQGRYALVATDYRMPGLTGLDLIARMRKAGRRTPAILITGGIDAAFESWVARRPKVGVLHKPFSPRELIRSVVSAMKK